MWFTTKYKAITYLALLAVPSMLYAQVTNVSDLFRLFRRTLNSLVPVLIGVAIVAFLFGMIRYIKSADNEKTREEGRQYMLYSIIALFVMVSLWGLVAVLTRTTSLNNSAPPIPQA